MLLAFGLNFPSKYIELLTASKQVNKKFAFKCLSKTRNEQHASAVLTPKPLLTYMVLRKCFDWFYNLSVYRSLAPS